MDALTFLRGDHQSVLGMMEVLAGAPTGDGAQQSGLETMVINLVIAESQHEAIEEQLFWPAVRAALGDGKELADRAVAQEAAGKKLLQQLEKGKPGQAGYHTALAEFIAAGREHIRYEQEVVWPKLKAAVSADDLEQLGEKLEKAKKAAPTRPHPHTPSGSIAQMTMGTLASIVDRVRDMASGRAEKNPPDAPKP